MKRAGTRSAPFQLRRGVKRLGEIGDDVLDMLEPDGEPHVAGGNAGRRLLGLGELAVRGAGRVDGERARIADIGDMVEQLQGGDEPLPRLGAAG